MKKDISILRTIHEILELTGNPYLVDIFNKYIGNEEKLDSALRNYTKGICSEIYENEDGDEENKKPAVIRFIYLNGVVIDAGNISRIELDCEYNPKKNKNNYFIRIVKKYPSPLEEEYVIPFDSEEDRDYGYEILKGKLKLCKLYIV